MAKEFDLNELTEFELSNGLDPEELAELDLANENNNDIENKGDEENE